MGIGIWTMHFIGMLALGMPMPLTYDVGITVFSLLVGMVASAFAIYVASRRRQGVGTILASSSLFGGGIAAMHYTGMEAMKMEATISYDTTLLVLSIVIAVVAAFAALWIISALTRFSRKRMRVMKVCAANIMGIAICGMHYTGMAAAIYTPFHSNLHSVQVTDNTWLAVSVGGVALIVLAVTHLTIFFEYRVGVERRQAATQSNLWLGYNSIVNATIQLSYWH